MRWTERRGMIGLLLCMAVFEFAVIKFTLASTTKAMIVYAVVMLLSYGIGIAAVFVSRIMSVLLRVLKEIKQSQLESLGYPADREVSASNGARTFVGRSRALGWWEIIGWLLALLVLVLTVAFTTLWLSSPVWGPWPWDMTRFQGAPITIDAPRGAGSPVYVHLYLRMDSGQCKVSLITPQNEESVLFWMGEGSWSSDELSAGDSLRLDPQGHTGEYWVHFE
ncbi:MAG: hypothetical protein ABSG67_19005 [Thermoguttaceae bacterium]